MELFQIHAVDLGQLEQHPLGSGLQPFVNQDEVARKLRHGTSLCMGIGVFFLIDQQDLKAIVIVPEKNTIDGKVQGLIWLHSVKNTINPIGNKSVFSTLSMGLCHFRC